MRRLVGLTVAAALVVAGGMATAQADREIGAVVITNTSCVLPDAEGGAFFSDDVRQFTVITPSGKINHYCHGQLPDGSQAPARALIVGSEDFGGASCITPGGGFTQDWQAVITPSGNVSINCNGA